MDASVAISDQKGKVGEEEKVLCCKKNVYFMSLISVLFFILFADQNLLAPVLTPVGREYNWTLTNETTGEPLVDEKGFVKVDQAKVDLYIAGYINLGFWIIGGIASVVVGYLADSVNRKYMLIAVIAAGETCCALTYFLGGTFEGLFICRVMTGVAIGGSIPIIFSLISDLFDVKSRGKAIAATGPATGLGVLIGQNLSAIVAGEDGTNWKMAFLFVSIPAYFVLAIFALTVTEPPRGTKEEALKDSGETFNEKITMEKFFGLLRTKTVLFVFLQGIPASLPWGVVLGIFTDFMIESKEVPRDASALVTTAFGGGALFGGILGGFLADRWASNMRKIPLLMGITTALGAIPMLILVRAPPLGVMVYCALCFPTGLIIGITGSAVKVVLSNVTTPETRGSAFGMFNLFDDLGKGAGVFIVAALSAAVGRPDAIFYSMFGWVVGAFFHFAMFFTVEKDRQDAQDRLLNKSGAGKPVYPSDDL